MTLLFALCGAGVGLGILLVIDGLRGQPGTGRHQAATRRSVRPERRVGLRLCLAAALGGVALVLTRWPVAAAALAAAGWFAPDLAGSRAEQARQTARTEAVAAWTEMLRDTIAGAHGLEEAIVTTAAVAPAAIAAEVAGLAVRLERTPLDAALGDFVVDLAHPTGDLVVVSLRLAARGSVGELAGLLGTLATAARDEAAMRLRIDATRARLRTTVAVTGAATVATALGLLAFDRSYLDAYDTAMGQAVLALVAGCWAASLWWLARMGRFVAPERFLAQGADR